MLLQENVPLAPLTTLKVGGPARFFVEAKSVSEVSEAVNVAHAQNLPLFVLGGGSNLVISDAGWPGLVLKIGITGIKHNHEEERVVFDAGAGEDWDAFVALAVMHKCAGIECLSGIPGSVGGTPVQNVGAYGQEVSQTIDSVLVLDLADGQVHEFCNDACAFGYRTSVFNTTHKGRYVILRVSYALVPGGQPQLEYADLKRYFAGWNLPPRLADVRDAVRKIRLSKGMLIVPEDDDCRSAGSFFRNPVLSERQYDEVAARAASRNLQIPAYPALASRKKISAAWLVEHSGFSKGFASGRVGISRKHALAIVNRGDATAADVLAFKNLVQQRVQDVWGVQLQPEPVFVGF